MLEESQLYKAIFTKQQALKNVIINMIKYHQQNKKYNILPIMRRMRKRRPPAYGFPQKELDIIIETKYKQWTA